MQSLLLLGTGGGGGQSTTISRVGSQQQRLKSEHWVFLDEAEETKFVRYGGAISQASEE